MRDSDRDGSLVVDGDRTTIRFRRRLPYPIEAVWAAITEPEQRRVWFGATTIEPSMGGAIEMMPDEPPAPPEAKRMSGRILAWEPPSRTQDAPRTAVFAHEWRQRIVEDGIVRYELTEDGDETILVFIHEGMGVRSARGFIPGEHAFLDRLSAHLAGGELPTWSERYAQVAPHYATD